MWSDDSDRPVTPSSCSPPGEPGSSQRGRGWPWIEAPVQRLFPGRDREGLKCLLCSNSILDRHFYRQSFRGLATFVGETAYLLAFKC